MKKNKMVVGASLTVEASFVVPIFLLCLILFLYIFQIIFIQDYIRQGISNVGYDLAEQAYIYHKLNKEEKSNDIESSYKEIARSFVNSGYIKLRMLEQVDVDYIDNSIIENGFSGLNFLSSSVLECNDEINIILKYQIKFPIKIFAMNDFNMVETIKLRAWTGFHINNGLAQQNNVDESNEVVYITRTGTVYHKNRDCSHIKLSVQSISSIPNDLRNNNGSKYSRCLICNKSNENGIYYITDEGDKYHLVLNCRGIKRDVLNINIKDIHGRRACSRCSKDE